MSDEIDTRITPSLHPSIVTKIEGYDDERIRPLLGPTETVFSLTYNSIREVWNTRPIVAKNRAWNDEQKILQISTFAEKKFAAAAKAIDSTMATLNRQIEHFEKELAAPIMENVSSGISAEIRAHAKGLNTQQRHEFVQTAIKEGDQATMKALLGAPPYLTGMTPDLKKTYLQLYNESVMPQQAKSLRALKAARDLIVKHTAHIHSEFAKAVGATPHEVAELRREQANAENALADVK